MVCMSLYITYFLLCSLQSYVPSASEGQNLTYVHGHNEKIQEFCSHLFKTPMVWMHTVGHLKETQL